MDLNFKIIYQDENILVVDKPAGIVVFKEGLLKEKTLIEYLVEKFPELKKAGGKPRYGAVHRLDRDTSGVLLVAKNDKVLNFLQNQFKKGEVKKTYLALVIGNIKQNFGSIKSLIGRDKHGIKQRVYSIAGFFAKKRGVRVAETSWQIERRFQDFTLVRAVPKTGRKHQLRVHLAHIEHPVAGDKLYSFKNQKVPDGLKRQFLHAYQIKIKLPDGIIKTFTSNLPENLNKVLNCLKKYEKS